MLCARPHACNGPDEDRRSEAPQHLQWLDVSVRISARSLVRGGSLQRTFGASQSLRQGIAKSVESSRHVSFARSQACYGRILAPDRR